MEHRHTVLQNTTTDCPVGVRTLRRRALGMIGRAVLAIAIAGGAITGLAKATDPLPAWHQGHFATVRRWLGQKPPPIHQQVLMGVIIERKP